MEGNLASGEYARAYGKQTEKTDAELIPALKEDDEESFKFIYFRYSEPLFRFLWRRLNNRETAEDLVQELFSRIWRNRANLDPAQSLKAYLYQTANNLIIDYLRKHGNMRFTQEVQPEHQTTETDETAFDRRNKIQEAVAELPETQRTVFCLSRFEGLKYTEIAGALSISVKTVETHMSRALKKLRVSLRSLNTLLLWFFFQ